MTTEGVTFKEIMAGRPSANGRYLKAGAVVGDVTPPRTAPDGYCQWCGKELPKRCKKYCPSELIISQSYTRREQRCAISFSLWWWGMPRYQRAVYVRDNFTCQFCGIRPVVTNEHGLQRPDTSQLAIDHIHPYSKGGKTEESNLQVACRVCNGKKGAKTEYVAPQHLL